MEQALKKMAEYILNSCSDYCSECCADFKACNERLANEDAPLPPDKYCIKNIIKFFEKE